MTTSGKQGLGFNSEKKQSTRDEVLAEVRREEESKRRATAATQRKQGAWLNWDGVVERKVEWKEIWKKEQHLLRFLIRAVYDQLPTPSNLAVWGRTEDPNCYLCGERGTLRHILSACPVSLAQGRYRWRHDSVLRQLAGVIDRERRKATPKAKASFINFVRAGEKGKPGENSTGVLRGGGQWEMLADLDKKLVFPQDIAVTNLRPDIVLWSSTSKQVVMVELTVPWEERVEDSYHLKRDKYTELQAECVQRGWEAQVLPVEVGCRGFPAQSLWSALRRLGVIVQNRKKAIQDIAEVTERASCWLWLRREEREWCPA